MGCSAEWLATGRQPKAAEGLEGDWTDVTGFTQSVGLGAGAIPQEYAETHKLKFRESSLRRKGLKARNLAVFYGEGDSMLPRIRPGDAIMFDTSDTTPRHGRLYVVTRDGEITVKRCEVAGPVVMFRADNTAGDHAWQQPKLMDDAANPIAVEGRVVWIAGWED